MIIPVFCNNRFVGALDGYSPKMVFSLTRRLSSYVGPAIRLRRVSDNAEQDIGFNSDGTLDTASATAFIGASYAKVTTWYDQKEFADAVQTTAANQPDYVNGTIDFDWTASQWLTCGTVDLYANSVYTLMYWGKYSSGPYGSGPLYAAPLGSVNASGSSFPAWPVRREAESSIRIAYGDTSNYRLGYHNKNHPYGIWENAAWSNASNSDAGQKVYLDGSEVALTFANAGTPTVPSAQNFSIGRGGAFNYTNYYWDGLLDDIFIFDSVKSADDIAAIYAATPHS